MTCAPPCSAGTLLASIALVVSSPACSLPPSSVWGWRWPRRRRWPQQPPTAQTGAATAVDTASATLAGVVDPNGSDTWYFFAYGVDRYDGRTPLARAGDGADPVAVSAAIAGLTPGTTYHVRLIAFSHHGFAARRRRSLHDAPLRGRARRWRPHRRPRPPPRGRARPRRRPSSARA